MKRRASAKALSVIQEREGVRKETTAISATSTGRIAIGFAFMDDSRS